MRTLPAILLASLLAVESHHAAGKDPAPGFVSIVNWDYATREKLTGWAATSDAILATLQAWRPATRSILRAQNTDPFQMRTLSKQLASDSASGRIIYLASHQNRAGAWEFPDGSVANMASEFEKISRGPLTILILDACHAASAQFSPGSNVLFLTSSTVAEEAFDIEFSRHRPYDAPRRHPRAHQWLKAHLSGRWDGRISLFGLCWVNAWLETPLAPETREEWRAFLEKVVKKGADFRANESRKLASTISLRAEP